MKLNTLIKNVTVIRPEAPSSPDGEALDLGIVDGRFARVEADIPDGDADTVIDGRGLLAFPGVVDAHQHWGIYNPLSEDTTTESRASAQGGVTTGLTYMRTGQYYLNRGGPYSEFFPQVLEQSRGRSFIDYGFHLAPMMREHIDEIPSIIEDFGVTSFKIFMFYGSHGLHGRSADQSSFLMIPKEERYDLAHFEFVMRGVQAAREKLKDRADHISLSLHCETWSSKRALSRDLLHTARHGRRTPRPSQSPLRRSSPTRQTCQTSTCCTCLHAKHSRPPCSWPRRSPMWTSVEK